MTLTLPQIGELMSTAVVRTVHATPGTQLAPGAKLFDVAVDLTAIAAQDCPPVSLYRIALRDRAWLREISVAPGNEIAVGAILARFSTEPDEPLAGDAVREVRYTLAGIIDPSQWWQGRP